MDTLFKPWHLCHRVADNSDNLHHLALLQKAGMIKHLGVTNVDFRHLRMLHSSGFSIATNQVSVSVLDTRARRMGEWAEEHGIALLAYGTLLGGFVSDKWLGKPEPQQDELTNWSLRKYKRFIDAAGKCRRPVFMRRRLGQS